MIQIDNIKSLENVQRFWLKQEILPTVTGKYLIRIIKHNKIVTLAFRLLALNYIKLPGIRWTVYVILVWQISNKNFWLSCSWLVIAHCHLNVLKEHFITCLIYYWTKTECYLFQNSCLMHTFKVE